MEFNKCKCCGAKDGRAVMLVSNTKKGKEGYEEFCLNCRDTFKSKSFVLHSDLSRTDEEINLMVEKLLK